LYDAAKLGGAFTLAALQVPENKFKTISDIVNHFPQVAHNYRREHTLNMWFVVACDKKEEIKTTLKTIETKTGLTVYNFPKHREFYIGLWLTLNQDGAVSTKSFQKAAQLHSGMMVIDEIDRAIINATQAGLPLIKAPYVAIAEQISSTAVTVMTRLKRMLQKGVIRRIGIVPNHYKLGLKANGMSVWRVPDVHIGKLGNTIGALDFVSHAYERPCHPPLWPYNLFAMVHGQNKAEVTQKVAKIVAILGEECLEYDVLFSSAILKKTGLRLRC
jgi:DNA-binding Lrp family transcriptional regulator